MARKKRGSNLDSWKTNRPDSKAGKLRIVGGKHRGRQLIYSGDQRPRPMKDNIREAVFNLVGGFLKERQVYDLFAGTGAIGIEAISRGASFATMIERHFPTAKIIHQNIEELQAQDVTEVVSSDTFFWSRKFLSNLEADSAENQTIPWAVFCCPPYDMYIEQTEDLMAMLSGLMQAAPDDSLFVVESDTRFDASQLPDAEQWKIRQYAPAQVCVTRTTV